MKHEWKKSEKGLYLPKEKPELVTVPKFKFFAIEGKGNPNSAMFAEHIGVLYSLAYGVKMSPKKGAAPSGYFDYTVYPIEGIWSVAEGAKEMPGGGYDKSLFEFNLMIRQPDFVDSEYAGQIIESTKRSKPHKLLNNVRFIEIQEGLCVQMLHMGSYDNEPQSFEAMESFAGELGYCRVSKSHREIYLSDARKVAPDKLKTVLRFSVRNN